METADSQSESGPPKGTHARYRRTWPGVAKLIAFGITVPVAALTVLLVLFMLLLPHGPARWIWSELTILPGIAAYLILLGQPIFSTIAVAYSRSWSRLVTLSPKPEALTIRSQRGDDWVIEAPRIASVFVEEVKSAGIGDSVEAHVLMRLHGARFSPLVTIETTPETAREIAAIYGGSVREGPVARAHWGRGISALVFGVAGGLVVAAPILVGIVGRARTLATRLDIDASIWAAGSITALALLGFFVASQLLAPDSLAMGNDGIRIGNKVVPWTDVLRVAPAWRGLVIETRTGPYQINGILGSRNTRQAWLAEAKKRIAITHAASEHRVPAIGEEPAQWIATLKHRSQNPEYRDATPSVERLLETLDATGIAPKERIAAAIALRAVAPEQAGARIRIAAHNILDDETRALLEALAEDDAAAIKELAGGIRE